MLKIIKKMEDICFPSLMEVYAESNRKTAAQEWPHLPEGFALQMAEQDFRQYLRDVFFHTSGSAYALWESNGKYVSALRLEPYRDGLLVEALETAPEKRGKGYAKSLMQAVQARYAGCKLYSHVKKSNLASLNLHEACGFFRIMDHAVFIDGSVSHRCDTFLYLQ